MNLRSLSAVMLSLLVCLNTQVALADDESDFSEESASEVDTRATGDSVEPAESAQAKAIAAGEQKSGPQRRQARREDRREARQDRRHDRREDRSAQRKERRQKRRTGQ